MEWLVDYFSPTWNHIESFYLNQRGWIDEVNRAGQFLILCGLVIGICLNTWKLSKRLYRMLTSSQWSAYFLARRWAEVMSVATNWHSSPLLMRAKLFKVVIFNFVELSLMIAVGFTFPDGALKVLVVWYCFLAIAVRTAEIVRPIQFLSDFDKEYRNVVEKLDKHVTASAGKAAEKRIEMMRSLQQSIEGSRDSIRKVLYPWEYKKEVNPRRVDDLPSTDESGERLMRDVPDKL